MERDQPPLNICAGTHLFGRSEQYPYAPSVHGIEQQFLGCVCFGVMDKRDLCSGNTSFDELRTDIVVNVESVRIGRRKVAKDQLGRTLVLGRLPDLDDAGNSSINLSLRFWLGLRIDQSHVERGF